MTSYLDPELIAKRTRLEPEELGPKLPVFAWRAAADVDARRLLVLCVDLKAKWRFALARQVDAGSDNAFFRSARHAFADYGVENVATLRATRAQIEIAKAESIRLVPLVDLAADIVAGFETLRQLLAEGDLELMPAVSDDLAKLTRGDLRVENVEGYAAGAACLCATSAPRYFARHHQALERMRAEVDDAKRKLFWSRSQQ